MRTPVCRYEEAENECTARRRQETAPAERQLWADKERHMAIVLSQLRRWRKRHCHPQAFRTAFVGHGSPELLSQEIDEV